MNQIRAIEKLTRTDLRQQHSSGSDAAKEDLRKSWHRDFLHSAYIYIGSLNFLLTEGDILTIFSQYGEIEDINLVRDKGTGKSKGFCFLKYENTLSAVLAVDNFNGITIAGRVIRVDHVDNYKQPEGKDEHEQADIEERRQEKLKAFEVMKKRAVVGKTFDDDDKKDEAEKEDEEDIYLKRKKENEEKTNSMKMKREAVAVELGLSVDDPMRDYFIDLELKKRKKSKSERR